MNLFLYLPALLLCFCPLCWGHSGGETQVRELTVKLNAQPKLIEERLARASLWTEGNELDRALDDLAILKKLAPQDHRALSVESAIFQRAGNFSEANRLLEQLIRENPNSPTLLERRIQLLQKMEQPAKLIATLDQLFRLVPKPQPDLLVLRTQLAEKLTGSVEALAWLEQRLADKPLPILESEAIRLQIATGQYAQALVRLEKQSLSQPRNLNLRLEKAKVLKLTGAVAQAQSILTELAQQLANLTESQRQLPYFAKLNQSLLQLQLSPTTP